MSNSILAPLEDPNLAAVPHKVEEPPGEVGRFPRRNLVRWVIAATAAAASWVFGMVSLVFGLSILAAIPIVQFLSLGYLLEASARVARTGRLRDGLIGIKTAAHLGGMVVGIWLALVPAWLVGSYTHSAELIDPGGPIAATWRWRWLTLAILTLAHIAVCCVRGGRFHYFFWPIGNVLWLIRRRRQGGIYSEARDRLWSFVAALGIPYYFRLGLVGFLGTLCWIAVPATLIGATGRAPLLGLIGALALAVIVPFLPFIQVGYAVDGHIAALFSRRAVSERFRRAPWAFAFSLMVLLVAAIPLYLLKIEMIPREAAWLPSLVFVVFLAPARLLTGWAYARSGRRQTPSHWFFRLVGRVAIIPAALIYVLVVFLGQYTSWGGAGSLYDQHAFLIPVPFLNM